VNSVDVQNQGDGRVVLKLVVPSTSENSMSTGSGVFKRAVKALIKAQQDGLLKKAQIKKHKKKIKKKKQTKYKNQRAGKKQSIQKIITNFLISPTTITELFIIIIIDGYYC